MRIFIALDIDDAIRERILRFVEGVRGFAPDARWVRPESLHVTLKFIGEKPAQTVEQIKNLLREVQFEAFDLSFRGYGFFPGTKAARVFWVGIESGPQLAAIAKKIDDLTSELGVPREDHAFSPHLTLARGGGRSGAPGWRKGDAGNKNFQLLQDKLSAMPTPEFGTMTAREFFLYESKLSKAGSRYSKLARFPRQRLPAYRRMNAVLLTGACSYLLGSIPFGYLLVRLFYGKDIRKTGSGNIGATNVARASRWLGGITLLLDAFKGVAAVLATRLLFPNQNVLAALAGFMAVAGHVFPAWLRFRGGKGVATGLAAFAVLVPKTVLVMIGVFLAIFLTFRYISLASILPVALFPLLAWILMPYRDAPQVLAFFAPSILIIAKHHANVRRLLAHTEPRFDWSRG